MIFLQDLQFIFLDTVGPLLPIMPFTRIKVTPWTWVITNTLLFNVIRNSEVAVVFRIIHLALHLCLLGTSTPGPFGIGFSTRYD